MITKHPWRRVLLTLACLAVFLTAGASLAVAATTVDPDTLARLEQELTLPICGLGKLETRMSQLEDTLGNEDPVPYLITFARKDPAAAAHASLPKLAVELLVVLAADGNDRARDELRVLFAELEGATDEHPRAMRQLIAERFGLTLGDELGLDVLLEGLRSDSVQVRADSFSALVPHFDEDIAASAVGLAYDPDEYVRDRLAIDLAGNSAAREHFLAVLATVEQGKSLKKSERALIDETRQAIAERQQP